MAGRKVVVTVAARRSEGEDQGIRAKARPTGSVEPGIGAGETSRPVEKWRRRLEKHGRDVVTAQPPWRDHRRRKRRKGRGCRDRRAEKREERTRSMEAAKGKILKLWMRWRTVKTRKTNVAIQRQIDGHNTQQSSASQRTTHSAVKNGQHKASSVSAETHFPG